MKTARLMKLDLTKKQAEDLLEGKSVTIKPLQMGKGLPLHLKTDKVKKMNSAKKDGKSYRLKLDEEEIELDGDGLWDWIKKGAKAVFKVGKTVAKPLLRVAAPLIQQKIGQKVGAKYGDAAGDIAGQLTGSLIEQQTRGRGMRQGQGMRFGGALGMVGNPPLQYKASGEFRSAATTDNYSPLIASHNVALNPIADKVADHSMARFVHTGMPLSLAGRQKPQDVAMFRKGSGIVPAGYRIR